MSQAKSAYSQTIKLVERYWGAIGGWRALSKSPYVHISILLTCVSFGAWTSSEWWNSPISVLPNMLGFSIGGMAIFLGLGSENFRELISGTSQGSANGDSPYVKATGTFVHFVVIQVVALLVALVLSAAYKVPFPGFMYGFEETHRIIQASLWAIGYALFIYSIVLALGTAMAVFRIARWYDAFAERQRSQTTPKSPLPPAPPAARDT